MTSRFAESCDLHRGYEGLVTEDESSPYVGGRTLRWLKVKQPKH